MDKPSYFFAIFAKENNFCDFLFASLNNKELGDYSERKKFLIGSRFFFLDLTPINKEGKMK